MIATLAEVRDMLHYLHRDDVLHDNPETERERRVKIYAAQYDSYCERTGERPDLAGLATGPVYCKELQCCFLTPQAAAHHLGLEDNRQVMQAIRRKGICHGLHFEIVPGAPRWALWTGRERAVENLDFDLVFDSLKEAAEWAEVASATLCNALAKARMRGSSIGTCGGMRWRYADSPSHQGGSIRSAA